MIGAEFANHFVWSADPVLFSYGFLTIRWYGLLFACGFFFGFQLITWIYEKENKPVKDLDQLFVYMVVGTIIGARLGHCLFYNPSYYLSNPIELLKVWQGGLASHGAVIGILTVLYIYSRIKKGQPYLWLVSRMTLIVALAAIFIRTGNFFNAEIVGKPSDLPWAVVFTNQALSYGPIVPRHPAQLYEAFAYLCIFLTMMWIYNKHRQHTRPEFLIGFFFTTVFTARFFIEFLKEKQADFEEGMSLDMGQLLSIPVIIFGLWMLFLAYRKRKIPYSSEEAVSNG